MFLFLVLCASIQTLLGASVSPPHPAISRSVATDRVFGALAPESPACLNDGGQELRSVFSILQSCLLTIFACVWTSAHPNINGPRDSWWACMKRRVITMLYAVLAPEAILLWALNQRLAAKKIAESYNKEFAEAEETETSLWGKVKGLFLPLPKETTWRGPGQLWTRTHGFFIQMGGFILYKNGYPTEVLDYERLSQLLRDNAIDAPTVTEPDLQDRSKGDAISKGIIVLQTTWFVVQCIARVVQRLPLSELEVLTLAFAVMNVVIYGVWWDKPQAVGTAICVPLKAVATGMITSDSPTPLTADEDDENPSQPKHANAPRPEYLHSNDDLPLIPRHHEHEQQDDESTGEMPSWLRRMLYKDRAQHSPPSFFLVRLPYRTMVSVARMFKKLGSSSEFTKTQLRVPMFYVSGSFDHSADAATACAFGVIFGAIHLLAWASKFPSPRDLLLWRVSTLVMTVEPLLVFIAVIIDKVGARMIFFQVFAVLYAFLLPFYIASRFVLIVVAFMAIQHPPSDVLCDISWTKYIPHF